MESQWTNKYDIMRDLYVAQGRIPIDVSGTLTAKAKPPNHIIIEENELEHFDDCCEDVEYESGADLNLIKEMLDMVKQTTFNPDVVSLDADNLLLITKHNPQCIGMEVSCSDVPNVTNLKPHKKRKQRNVAITSILEALSSHSTKKVEHDEHVKLLKPEDFIKSENDSSVAVVDEIINSANSRIESTITFKKKDSEKNVKDCDEINLNTESKSIASYRPSSMASFYYKKYLERSKLKESMQDDVKAEDQEVQKKINIKELDVVRLPQHRHLLTDDCIVCRVLCKKYVK
ncbi:unnamed protein product [Parnassius apollo]|uniref:(apollo) hypothetical protein n=1 Tax=Parnassius apollo TaxID=110799 RepID=A0A8S3WB12_PARAO|nr:unnamed protein product [Parnassius apollo]